MALKKFTRYTKGVNQQVVVAKAIAITTQATYTLFVANAALGEIGVYDVSNNLYTVAMVAGKQYYFCQKRTGGTFRTPLYTFNGSTFLRTAYVAPVAATGSIGWSGTAGALNLAAVPAVSKQYEIGVLETTEGTEPFPTWNFNYIAKPNDVEADVMQALAKLINDASNVVYTANQPLVNAVVKASATYGNYTTTGTYTATLNSVTVALTVAATDPAVGDYIAFNATATPTNTIGDVYKVTAVSAGVSFTLNRPYQGATQTFIAAEASGTRVKKVTAFVQSGLVLTTINNTGESFRILVRQELQYADVVNLATFTRGNGTFSQVEELEKEGWLMQGNTARNTQFGDAAYGDPDKFTVLSTETYDLFNFNCQLVSIHNSTHYADTFKVFITLAAPKSAGGLSASLNTIFGT